MKASYLKRYPLSHLVTAVIIILSLAPIPDVPQLASINLFDKWTHFVMYAGLCLVIWWEYLRQHRTTDWRRVSIGAILLPIILGGLMELGQTYLTTCRSGEWLDFIADSVGVLLALMIANPILSRIYRD